MAISIKDRYPSKVDTTDAAYPQGKARNVTVSLDGTGTPFEKDLVNDIMGFQQAIYKEAGITPSGTPDTADVSQQLDGLKVIQDARSINDLSQSYTFTTVAAFKASLIEFPDSKTIHLLDRGADFTKITGNTTTTDRDIIFSTNVNQSIEIITSAPKLSQLGAGEITQALLDSVNYIEVDIDCSTSAQVDIDSGQTITINKFSIVSVNHSGFAFRVLSNANLLGDGLIKYTVATVDGPILMKPDGIVDYAFTNFPTVGNLRIQSYNDLDLQGAGITWDMSLGNGSFAVMGNLRIRGFDKTQEFIVPAGQFITSVQFGDVIDLYCRATIDESGTLGQIGNFHFNSLTVQPRGSVTVSERLREYGIKSDNMDFLAIDDAIFWDWDTKTDPALIKEKILLGSNTRQNKIITLTTNQPQVTDYGTENVIRISAAGGTLNPHESITTPSNAGSFLSFGGHQDNMLSKADRNYTVTSSALQGGTNITAPFDILPNNYSQFLADGTEQFIQISLGGETRVAAMGAAFLDGNQPDNLAIDIWYTGAGAWETLYDSDNPKTLHSASTENFRGVVTDIRFRMTKATDALGIRIPMIFAYSPDIQGKAFLDVDGINPLYKTVFFAASANGEGFRMISPNGTPYLFTVSDGGLPVFT